MTVPLSGSRRTRLILNLALFGLATLALRLEGRRWWCRCGRPFLWSVGVRSPHTSQHLGDPYTWTHLLHGLAFHALLRPLARWIGPGGRLTLALALEAVWEILENSPIIIERYRRGTVSLGYVGDSVANSLGDIAACGLGLLLAAKLPVRWSVLIFLGVEAALLIAYRDNLTLNVLMLVWPIEAIKAWQMGHA